jgi:hypothetical protein
VTAAAEKTEPAPRLMAAPSFPAGAAFRQAVRHELSLDWPIYALAAFYVLAAMVLALALPGRQHLTLFLYVPLWLRGGLVALLLFLIARSLPGVIRERSDRPLFALAARMAAFVTPRAVAGLALIALQVVLMGTFTSVKNMLPDMATYSWDGFWANVDAALHGGHDPWTLLTSLVSQPAALKLVEFVYASGWMVMIGLVPAIVALSPKLAPIRVRFFLTYILSWMLIGNLLALLFMSAGPAFFAEIGDGDRFRPLLDHVAANSGTLWSARDIQTALWQVYEHGMVSFGTGISAFPSMHLSMATLWAITAFRRSRRLGAAALVFLAFILTGSVALGWHYAVDGYAAILLTVLIWIAVGRLPAARFMPPKPSPAGV